jgi:tetratricopeptide (TPR) repeat protein
MQMRNVGMPKVFVAGAAALAFLAFSPPAAWSVGDPPKPSSPKCSEHKKGSPGWKRCMGQELKDDEATYELGYTLAKSGDYAEALTVLRSAAVQSDPRIQTMIGFSLRKMGHVDAAMAYYAAALSANPHLTNTRQYLGEAFLQKNDQASARQQLAEIGARCGTGCEDYAELAKAIAAHEARG